MGIARSCMTTLAFLYTLFTKSYMTFVSIVIDNLFVYGENLNIFIAKFNELEPKRKYPFCFLS